MQRIGEALQRSQRGGGKPSNYKTTSRWLYINKMTMPWCLITNFLRDKEIILLNYKLFFIFVLGNAILRILTSWMSPYVTLR
jgi:hypothetical protein